MGRVAIVGAGYVGLCTAVALAEHGHHVTIVDVDNRKLDAVRRGRAPFFEPGLDDLLAKHVASGRLRATHALREGIAGVGFVFLCVGTPSAPDGSMDLRYVRQAASDVGFALHEARQDSVLITKSTVPPGTGRAVVAPALAAAGIEPRVASNPEFLREGCAVQDALSPDRIVVGADHPEVAARVWTLYEGQRCPKLSVDLPTAEFIKYAANAFLATKIALSNELANVAERAGVEWYEVAKGIGLDARIGPLFLRAGAGFGGSCFPKDLAGLEHVAMQHGQPSRIVEAVLRSNNQQPLVTVAMLREELGTLDGKRIALLGLAFKPDTDDVRETRALPIYEELRKAGADVVVHDPRAAENFARLAPGCNIAANALDALDQADGAIAQTEWREYYDLDPKEIVAAMRSAVIVDGRRAFDGAALERAGVRYRAIGRGSKSP